MSNADIIIFPGVGDAAGSRPATFDGYLVSIGLSKNTIRVYKWQLTRAEEHLTRIGTTLLSAGAYQLAAMAAATPNAHSTRGHLKATLKHYYEWQDRMDAPLRAVRIPPKPEMVNRALDVEDTKRLVATALGWWPQGGAVLLGLYLALRRFEIGIAEWDRFDEEMGWYTVLGKNDKTATIPVHPIITEEFGARRGEGFIFPGRKNGRDSVCPASIWSWTKEVAREAGLETFTTHQLRHTALTTANDNTADIRAVSKFARHTKIQTTMGYTRTTKEQLLAVSDALDF